MIYLAALIISIAIIAFVCGELWSLLWRPMLSLVFAAGALWLLSHGIKSIGYVHIPHPDLVFHLGGFASVVFLIWVFTRKVRA
jgi:hypothetical protein